MPFNCPLKVILLFCYNNKKIIYASFKCISPTFYILTTGDQTRLVESFNFECEADLSWKYYDTKADQRDVITLESKNYFYLLEMQFSWKKNVIGNKCSFFPSIDWECGVQLDHTSSRSPRHVLEDYQMHCIFPTSFCTKSCIIVDSKFTTYIHFSLCWLPPYYHTLMD